MVHPIFNRFLDILLLNVSCNTTYDGLLEVHLTQEFSDGPCCAYAIQDWHILIHQDEIIAALAILLHIFLDHVHRCLPMERLIT